MLTESVDYEQFMNYNFLINSSIDSNKHYAQTDIVWKEPIYKIWLMEKKFSVSNKITFGSRFNTSNEIRTIFLLDIICKTHQFLTQVNNLPEQSSVFIDCYYDEIP